MSRYMPLSAGLEDNSREYQPLTSGVVKKGVQPEGWCFDHDVPRRVTKAGSYVHPFIDGDQQVFCTKAGLLDSTGKPITGDPVEGE